MNKWGAGGLFLVLLLFLVLSESCDSDVPVFLTLDDEKNLGLQISEQVSSDSTVILLSTDDYHETYSYLDTIFAQVLNVKNEDGAFIFENAQTFEWQVVLVEDSDLNAWVAPGGYVFISTGMLKFLDTSDQLAGLLAHQIIHVDERHVTERLLYAFSSQYLLNASKTSEEIKEITSFIFSEKDALRFSQSQEQAADRHSVSTLSKTIYSCQSPYNIFQKLIRQFDQGNPPRFLDKHNYDGRLDYISERVQELACNTQLAEESEFTYQDFQNSLP